MAELQNGQRAGQHVEHSETFDYSTNPESVRQARDDVSKSLCSWGFDAIADDLILCLSEAFTNALLYAGGQHITVHVIAFGARVHIEVYDCADAVPQLSIPSGAATGDVPPLDAVSDGGRGLLLIQALATRWGVRRVYHSMYTKAVWFERDIDGQGATA